MNSSELLEGVRDAVWRLESVGYAPLFQVFTQAHDPNMVPLVEAYVRGNVNPLHHLHWKIPCQKFGSIPPFWGPLIHDLTGVVYSRYTHVSFDADRNLIQKVVIYAPKISKHALKFEMKRIHEATLKGNAPPFLDIPEVHHPLGSVSYRKEDGAWCIRTENKSIPLSPRFVS